VLSRIAPRLGLALLLSVSLAQAERLGEAINLSIGPSGAGALAGVPPEALAALHSASSLLGAHAQGLVSGRTAALALAGFADELVDAHPRFDELDEQAFRVALILESRVVVAGAGEVLRSVPDGPERMALLHAAERVTKAAAASAGLRVHAGADGPDNACFQQYGDCMQHCAGLDGFTQRSLCGMDCNLDFAACLGTAVGRGIGPLIRVLGEVSAVTSR
jgi:hypothetical protein